jgi:divalent metal cation (Fe/Co/Zn/Cd) transporter
MHRPGLLRTRSMTSSTSVALSRDRKKILQRRIRWIVAVTIGYNLIEAAVSIAAGSAASSTALIGFGLDSFVEVLSAAAVAWQFTRKDPERYEKPVLRVIAVAFFILAAYVTTSAILSLTGVLKAEHSAIGIVVTALSVIVMPVLSLVERHTGRELGSATAGADSKQTLICTYLSAAVLIGLLLNIVFGWAWADPIAALVIVVFAVREGLEALKGETDIPVGLLLGDVEDAHEEAAS